MLTYRRLAFEPLSRRLFRENSWPSSSDFGERAWPLTVSEVENLVQDDHGMTFIDQINRFPIDFGFHQVSGLRVRATTDGYTRYAVSEGMLHRYAWRTFCIPEAQVARELDTILGTVHQV